MAEPKVKRSVRADYTGMGTGFMKNPSNIPMDPKIKMNKVGARIYNNITPFGYLEERVESAGGSKVKAISKIAKDLIFNKGREGVNPEREEIWKYALGSNEEMTQWEKSPYKPSTSKDSTKTYLRLNNIIKDDNLLRTMLESTNPRFVKDSTSIINERFRLKNQNAMDNYGNNYSFQTTDGKTRQERFINPMANYKVSRGKDENGDYVSIYDKWDLDNIGDKFLKRTPEIYDRIYYEKGKDYNYANQLEKTRDSLEILENNQRSKYKPGDFIPDTDKNYNVDISEINNKLYSLSKYTMKEQKQKYPLGGWLKENAGFMMGPAAAIASAVSPKAKSFLGQNSGGITKVGLGIGAMFVPGMQGAGMGMITGGAGEVAGNIQQGNALQDQEQLLAQQKAQFGQANTMNPYQDTFPYGGMVPGETPVELEKEEVFQTPDGQMGQVDGPSHAQGGVDMSLPAGTFVWSDKLKTASGRTFADEAAYLGKLKTKYEKILNS